MQSENVLRSDYGGYDSDEETGYAERAKDVSGIKPPILPDDMTIAAHHAAHQQAAAVAAAQMAAMHAAVVAEDNFPFFPPEPYGPVSEVCTKWPKYQLL